MSRPSWHKIKPKILELIEETKTQLTTCSAADLPKLQARVAAYDEVIGLFEQPDEETTRISAPGGY